MNSHYMLWDFVRTSEAVLLFPLVVIVPGYVIAWLLDLLAFRQRMLLMRLTISLPVSIGICPVITYYLWRVFPSAVWLFYGSCAAMFVFLMFRERQEYLSRTAIRICFNHGFTYFAIIMGWAIIAMLALIDMQVGHRLYFPTVTYDYALRAAFTSAISRTGVPPHNPYFFPGHFFNLRYHYFWFILCSVVQRVAGATVSPRQAMLAGTVWCGIGLIAIVPLYLRFFQSKGEADLGRRALIGISLLAVTGLDIYPVLVDERALHLILPSIEWWNSDTVMAWLHAVMWLPHHVAGLIACLMGFLLLWDAARSPVRRRTQILVICAAALMFVSASGMTIYVTLVFAIFLAVWMCIAFLRSNHGIGLLICLSGVAALILSLPWLFDAFARTPGALHQPGSSWALPFQFAVRRLLIFDLILGLGDSGWQANLANLLVLPINYLLEFGFFLIAGIIQSTRMWRNRRNLTEDQLCGFTMAMTGILICTFFRSTVITNNDLGWRGILVAQFVFLIWGTELLADGLLSSGIRSWNITRLKRHFLAATIALGVAGTLYEIVKVRFYPLQSDTTSIPLYPWLSPDRNLGARTFALRELYEELKRRTPTTAVFQHNPNVVPQDHFHGMYADRQLAAETTSCAVVFGGNASVCRSRIGTIEALFDNPKAFQPSDIDDTCRQLSIDVLVVKDTDKVWQDRESWVWHRTPMLANNYARAFDCGSAHLTLTGIR